MRLSPTPRPTQVLDLNDVLVSKHWTRKKGWTLYKRPGAQDFLAEMGQYFEIVIFTDEPSSYAMPVISKLDKHNVRGCYPLKRVERPGIHQCITRLAPRWFLPCELSCTCVVRRSNPTWYPSSRTRAGAIQTEPFASPLCLANDESQ